MDRFDTRRDQLRKSLKKSGVDTLLVTNFTNVTYLTGFTGDDSYLLVAPQKQILVSDARYTTQIEEECPRLEMLIRPPGQSMLVALEKLAKKKIKRLGIEGDSMTVALRQRLAEKLGGTELVTTTGLVEELRMCKDKEEVAEIRRAADIAQRAFDAVRAGLRPEQTEKEVADCAGAGNA